ncbi:MAG: ribosome recycling factor [Clostridia bacterium]|nr:ribosome recycling factor [Clostridia bacterium]
MPTAKELIENSKSRMVKTQDAFKRDMQSLRAGRANPQILDRVSVEYYGSMMPINQVGNISAPEPRMLVIAPWDQKAIPAIEKAIQKSDLGLNPSNDGHVVRLIVPELNEERRKELTKVVRKTAEESKVACRNIRRDAMEVIKKMKKDNELTEDEQHKAEDDLQKVTDNAIKEIDKLSAEKEKEIMAV